MVQGPVLQWYLSRKKKDFRISSNCKNELSESQDFAYSKIYFDISVNLPSLLSITYGKTSRGKENFS